MILKHDREPKLPGYTLKSAFIAGISVYRDSLGSLINY